MPRFSRRRKKPLRLWIEALRNEPLRLLPLLGVVVRAKQVDVDALTRKHLYASYLDILLSNVAGRAPTVEGISRMEYLSCVVKECLRLFPS